MFKYTFFRKSIAKTKILYLFKNKSFNFRIYFYLLFCKIVVQSIFLSLFSKHLLYNSYIFSFVILGSFVISFFFGVSSFLLESNKLRAIALPIPNPNPCFIESTIEGDCEDEYEGKGEDECEGKGEGKGEGARRGGGIFCFVSDDFEFVRFTDLGISYKL
jgi:hypothetical protein